MGLGVLMCSELLAGLLRALLSGGVPDAEVLLDAPCVNARV